MVAEGGNDMDASELMQKEIDRVKENQSQLYSLDREKQKVMTDIQTDIAEIKAEHKNTKEDMSEVKKDVTEMKREISDINNTVSEVKHKVESLESKFDVTDKKVDAVKDEVVAEIKTLKNDMNRNKWQPKDWCVIIVAAFSLIGTLLTAILTK